MPLKTTVGDLQRVIADLHLADDGDGNERRYWAALHETFPNYERFWQRLVVPMTKRIELPRNSPARHERRNLLADDVWLVSYLNYSLFLHLAYASDHRALPLESSFGDFYTHLGSVCDLAEDFLLAVHLLVSECRNLPVPVLLGLSRKEFLEMAARWYEKEYPKAYDHYHRKGKGKPVYLPPRQMILDTYFPPQDAGWKAYAKFSNQIRGYRNKVVHDVAMGTVLSGKFHLVPRKERVHDYTAMRSVQEAAGDIKRLKRDFIVREEQMSIDLHSMQVLLNGLWEKPIADLSALFYEEQNAVLLRRYNVELAEGSTNLAIADR